MLTCKAVFCAAFLQLLITIVNAKRMAKKFIVNDDSVLNDRGFRVMTQGIKLDKFKKNPLGLFMHSRPDRWDLKSDSVLPICTWSDPEVEGNVLNSTPTFDESDEFAKKIGNKVENGFLRMASIGIIPITVSSDPAYMLPGQDRPTIVECELIEISIVDIGSNPNAVSLYSVDPEGKLVQLSSELEDKLIPVIAKPENEPNMKKIAEKLNLSSEATEDQIVNAVELLLNANKQLVTDAETVRLSSITSLVEQGITEGRFTADKKDHMITLGKTSGVEVLKTTIDLLPKASKPTDGIDTTSGAPETETITLASLMAKGADEIRKYKETEPQKYAKIYKDHYGREYVPGK